MDGYETTKDSSIGRCICVLSYFNAKVFGDRLVVYRQNCGAFCGAKKNNRPQRPATIESLAEEARVYHSIFPGVGKDFSPLSIIMSTVKNNCEFNDLNQRIKLIHILCG